MSRTLRGEFRVSYFDQEMIQQSLHNDINHWYELYNIVDYKSQNFFLSGSQVYEASAVNVLYVVADNDFNLLIDGSKSFAVREFFLVQHDLPFSFKISQLNTLQSLCTINLHVLHAKLGG